MNKLEELYQKALSNAKTGNFAEALEWVKKMHILEPNNADVYFIEVAIQMEAKDYVACAEACRECILLNPNHGSAWNHWGICLCFMDVRYVKDAMNCFKKAMDLNTPGAADNYNFWLSTLK